jgi:uncharacterized protein (TIGR03435 family)
MIELVLAWTIRSSVLIGSGALLLRVSRIRDASTRLAAWTAVLAGSLAIPFLGSALPQVPIVWERGAAARPVYARPPVQISAPAAAQPLSVQIQSTTGTPKVVDYRRIAALLYAAVAGLLLLRLCIGLAMSLRLRRASRATDLENVRESDRLQSPVTLSILRPVIVLPADWREWNETKLAAVLAHERSHIERWDPAVQLFSAIHRALLWISPLTWMLDRWIVQAAEEASDDAAIAATADRAGYAEVLLHFIAKGVEPAGVGMARDGRADKRIDRVLDGVSLSRGVTHWSASAIVLLACPVAYLAAAATPQKGQAIRFPALPAPPSAPEPVQLAQARTPTPEPAEPQKPPTFDAVSIKPLPPGPGRGPISTSGCRPLRFTTGMVSGSATVSKLIQEAYGLSPFQVSGGPDWVSSDRFCVEAKSAGPAEKDQLALMLRSMLADRFQFVLRLETKQMPVYLMTVAKPGRLFEVEPGVGYQKFTAFQDLQAMGYKVYHQPDGPIAGSFVDRNTMQGFADFLSNSNLVGVTDRPVLDRTGLSGTYVLMMQIGANETPLDAAADQFGLKFVPSKVPLPSIVIERIERPSAD